MTANRMTTEVKQLVVVLGPTAVGKTTFSIKLAKHYRTEIVSADSRQFYTGMKIGTAAPSPAELAAVPHHFIGHLPLAEPYNVSRYESDALLLLGELFRKHDRVLLTGGSGLYIDAVCSGIDELPDPDPELRELLKAGYRSSGISILRDQLRLLDPDFYHTVDLANPTRLIRAIEVCLLTGKPYSSLRSQSKKDRPFRILKIGLALPRDILNERIGLRVDAMMTGGLLEEVRDLFRFRHLNALNTVGYRELFRHIEGQVSLQQAVEDIKTNTRRYAKRQMTWFRRDPSIKWFHPGELPEVMAYLDHEAVNS